MFVHLGLCMYPWKMLNSGRFASESLTASREDGLCCCLSGGIKNTVTEIKKRHHELQSQGSELCSSAIQEP